MGLFDRFRRSRTRAGSAGTGTGGREFRNTLDREATREDLDDLRAFARSRVGIELYVEPETTATDTTAVAVAADGEWTRRRVGSPRAAQKLARELAVPIYDAAVLGYPKRMREYDRRRRSGSG